MSNIVKFTQFKNVMSGLWTKAKEKFVSDVTLVQEQDTNDNNKQKYKLQVTKNNNPTKSDKFLVTEWKDLKYTSQYTHKNLLNIATYEDSKSISQVGAIGSDDVTNGWGVVEVKLEQNETYTLVRKRGDNLKARVEYQDGTFDFVNVAPTSHDGWNKYNFTVKDKYPTKVFIEVYTKGGTPDTTDNVILLQGNHMTTTGIVPTLYTGGKDVFIGKEVGLGFDNSNSSYTSTTVEDAIKETETMLGDYVHKDMDVVLSGKVTLENGYITNTPISVQNPTQFKEGGTGMGINGYTILEYTKAPANTKVTKLVVGMHESYEIGQSIDNIYIGVKEQGDNKTIKEYILNSYSTVVIDNPVVDTKNNKRLHPISSEKVVVLPINKTYEYDAPFILSVPGMIWGGRSLGVNAEYLNSKCDAGGPKPEKGQSLNKWVTGDNSWIGRVVVYGEDLPIKDLVTTELSKDQVLSGKVTHINGVIAGQDLLKINNTSNTNKETILKENSFFVCSELTATKNDTKISQITIGIDDRIPEGTVVKGVNIGKVIYTGGNNYAINNNGFIIKNGSGIVYKNTNRSISSSRAITVNVDITLQQNERIFVGALGMVVAQSTSAQSFNGDIPANISTTQFNFPMSANTGKTGQVIAHTSETPFGKLIKDVSYNGALGRPDSSTLTFHMADGSTKKVAINGGVVNPTQFDLVGQTRTYIAKRTPALTTFKHKSNVYNVVDTPDETPTEVPVTQKFPQITGEKIEMQGCCWVLCEGQQVTHSVTQQPITLPRSSEGNYIYLCLGK